MNPPLEVLGVPVVRVVNIWWVDDIWGSRSYCKVETEDGREVTMLRTEDGWTPTLVSAVP